MAAKRVSCGTLRFLLYTSVDLMRKDVFAFQDQPRPGLCRSGLAALFCSSENPKEEDGPERHQRPLIAGESYRLVVLAGSN